MPVYQFRCRRCGDFDIAMPVDARNEPVTCDCGSEASRVFAMPAVKYKGTGFFTTDVANLDKQKAQGRKRVREGEVRPQSDLTQYE